MTRCQTETIKIGRYETGLAAACYLHVDFDDDGRPVGVSFSSPGKFEKGALDKLFRCANAALAEAFEPIDLRGVVPPKTDSEAP